VKRPTPLKKTVEFKPSPDIIHTQSNPTITSTMYNNTPQKPQLPGQLSSHHVSFV